MTTRHTVSSTSAGSDMGGNLGPQSKEGKEIHAPWLLRLAKRWNVAPSYAKALVFDRDRSYFTRVHEAIEEMAADGLQMLVDRRLLAIDLARACVDPNTAEHPTAVVEAIRSDAASDAPIAEYLVQPNTDNYKTAKRTGWDAVRGFIRFTRSGDRVHGRSK